MYKVLQINDYAHTRDVLIKNTETGTIDTCFDDSMVVSEKNFDFIKIGDIYHCKIKLFGRLSNSIENDTLKCKLNKLNAPVGTKMMAQILIDEDIYYIPQYKVDGIKKGETFLFRCSRKDLIQVDDVIHADLLGN